MNLWLVGRKYQVTTSQSRILTNLLVPWKLAELHPKTFHLYLTLWIRKVMINIFIMYKWIKIHCAIV